MPVVSTHRHIWPALSGVCLVVGLAVFVRSLPPPMDWAKLSAALLLSFLGILLLSISSWRTVLELTRPALPGHTRIGIWQGIQLQSAATAGYAEAFVRIMDSLGGKGQGIHRRSPGGAGLAFLMLLILVGVSLSFLPQILLRVDEPGFTAVILAFLLALAGLLAAATRINETCLRRFVDWYANG